MKIAFFSDQFYPELSGVADSVLELGRELARRGHELRYVVPRYPRKDYLRYGAASPEPEFPSRVEVIRLPSLPHRPQGRTVLPLPILFPAARKILAFRPDIIHAQLPYGTGIQALLAARKLKIPLVGTDHTLIRAFVAANGIFRAKWSEDLASAYDAWFYGRCSFVSAPSRAVFEGMNRFDLSVPHRVISNPVRPGDFSPPTADERDSARKKFGAAGFVLLYAGRLAPEKDLDVVLNAVASAKTEMPELELLIAGRGPSETSLRKIAERTGISNSVRFLGLLRGRELVSAYHAADAFVIMSTSETQSLTTMQAMLSGLPVIAARAAGLAEYVRPEIGLPVEPGDVSSLVQRISELRRDPALRSRLGTSARRAVKEFSADRIAAIWEGVYRNLLAGRTGSGGL
ncbi:MAG: hypothetical protein UY99_C0006G0013 [Parcubacteria group bacterium GW2011_GWA1_59_11]|nr:MAG: hypothetical protein UY99_C0006G0013 [Parcubacteria group bacterium GW2011_GWA1_59_11]